MNWGCLLPARNQLDHLAKARAAYDRREWRVSYDAFVRANDVAPLDVSDLERLATVSYLIGRDPEFRQRLEQLYRLHLDAGDPQRAARAAFWLALSHMLTGDVGHTKAWTMRGDQVIGDRDCVERGYVLLLSAEQAFHAGQPEAALGIATEAAVIATRCHDADLQATCRHAQGRSLIARGQIAEGMAFLDEMMLAVVEGALSPIVTGLMYCSVIGVCRGLYEVRRAREWTSAMSAWCETQSGLGTFTGVCRAHRAEILQLEGAWGEALDETSRASEYSRRMNSRRPGAALYQAGEIYRLRGECAAAEDAYREASQAGFEPQPGLALLRLAQGRTAAAAAAIRRLLIAATDRLERARLLPAYIEILLAAEDVDDAAAGTEELRTIAATFDTDMLHAVTEYAAGAIAMARGDARSALGPLRRAFELWNRLEAPYEAARARVLLGRACKALGDAEASALEFAAARGTFVALGAPANLAKLDAELDSAPPAGRLSPRELEVLRMVAAGRTNRDIAGALHLSERTIDRHVSNILDKLDVRSRTAATTYAHTHQLLS